MANIVASRYENKKGAKRVGLTLSAEVAEALRAELKGSKDGTLLKELAVALVPQA